MPFQKTTAQRKILELTKRIRVVQGGTSASKTYSIMPILASYAMSNRGLEISVVSESYPHLRRGAFRDFKKIMIDIGLWREEAMNNTRMTYTFANGSFIEFFSADQPDKQRGARRDILFVNEANNINWEAYHQLAIRTRKFIYIDFNPSHEFWAHVELQNDPDAQWLTLTYKDNEATPKEIVRELDKAIIKAKTSDYWKNWVNVYVYGKLGVLQGVVFEDWDIIKELPEEAKLISYGIDFGFTVDPSAIITGYQYNGEWILDEVCYGKEMLNKDIIKEMNTAGIPKTLKGMADSAEPKSIAEIRRAGYNLTPVEKGRDSIAFGISVMQENRFHVTARSVNLIKELRNYSWDKDKHGNTIARPIDDYNHAIDAARYMMMMYRRSRKSAGKSTSAVGTSGHRKRRL